MNTVSLVWYYALAISAFGALQAVRNIANGRRSVGWPEVPGEVLKATARNVGRQYVPVVRYRYRFGEATYGGSRITYSPIVVLSKSAVKAFLRPFQSGLQVAVRVDPQHPQRSVLRPGDRFQNWVELLAALSFGAYVGVQLFRGV